MDKGAIGTVRHVPHWGAGYVSGCDDSRSSRDGTEAGAQGGGRGSGSCSSPGRAGRGAPCSNKDSRQLDGWVSIGEPFWIWDRAFPLMLCECGKEFGRCEFWQTVLHEAYGNEQYAVREHVRVQARGLWRHSILPTLAHSDAVRPSQALAELGDLVAPVYETVARLTGANTVVDAVEVRTVGPRARGRDPRRPARDRPRAGPGVVPRCPTDERGRSRSRPAPRARPVRRRGRCSPGCCCTSRPTCCRATTRAAPPSSTRISSSTRLRPRVRWRGRSIPPRTWTACSTATGSSCAARAMRSAATRADRDPVRRRLRASAVPRIRTWRRCRVPC